MKFVPRSKLASAVVIAALVFFLVPAEARTKSKNTTPAVDPEYVWALATAERFLHAWRMQDHETGVLLLTDSAKQHISEETLESFFAPADSAEEAFEITRGKKLQPGRYAFPVVLWRSVPGKKSNLRPRFSEMVVVRTGKNDWAIDKLP